MPQNRPPSPQAPPPRRVSAGSAAQSWALALGLFAGSACREDPRATGEPPAQQDAYRLPERLISALPLRRGARVADIGAGGGYLTLRLARVVGPEGHVVATDIDANALRSLGLRAAQAGLPQIEIRVVRPADPGLEPARYDLVLLAQVDHLLKDRAAYLRALVPSLSPGGAIAISNHERHLQAALYAARAASLGVTEVPAGLPGQFLLILRPPQ